MLAEDMLRTKIYQKAAIMTGLFALILAPFLTRAQTAYPTFKNCRKCIVMSEQSLDRIAIADVDKKAIVWDWQAAKSIKAEHLKWFKYPSEAKAVLGGRCVLMTASGGAVALIRIAGKKVLFYAYAGGNTHSAELLPDGNIVSASSDGNCLTVFHTDTLHFPENVYHKQVYIAFGHNVVWDKSRQILWSAGMNQLKAFKYNFNCQQPDLKLIDSVTIPGAQAHDLFPVDGKQALWLTNITNVFQYDIASKKLNRIAILHKDIKSISTGQQGNPDLMTFPNGEAKSWWTDKVTDIDMKVIFQLGGLKIYKARWFNHNSFSYSGETELKVCK